MKDEARHWNLYYQKTFEEDTKHSRYAEEKEVLFPRNSIIVDLGGGIGNDAMYFLEKGHSVIILDISDFALAKAFERAKMNNHSDKLVVKQVDFGLHSLPIKSSSIDVAYSRISLNYFGREDTIRLYKDIYNFLKTGGKAYLTFKSPDDYEEMQYLQKRASIYEENVFIDNGQLRSRFTMKQHIDMLSESGIANYEVKPYNEVLSSHKEGHRNVLPATEVIFTKL